MSEPNELPEWGTAADPADIESPPGQIKTNALRSGDFLLREWANWFFNTVYLWILYLKTTSFKTSNGIATVITDNASFHAVNHSHLGLGEASFSSDVLLANQYLAGNVIRSQGPVGTVAARTGDGLELGYFRARNTFIVAANTNIDGTISAQSGTGSLSFSAGSSSTGVKVYSMFPAIDPPSNAIVTITLFGTTNGTVVYSWDGAGSEITVRTFNAAGAATDRAFSISITDVRP
jgi:hypothetical protein